MLELIGITKRFGPTTAVRDLSAVFEPGVVTGLLGPNGAGKTTTIRIAVGAAAPDRGRVRIDNTDTMRNPARSRAQVGWLPETAPLYTELKPIEHLRHRAALYGIPPRDRASRIAEACERCGLAGLGRKRIGQLSKGYRQRVGLAAALLHDPSVLVLDEPSSGLDPTQNRDLLELLTELARTKTVVLSTHVLRDVELACGRILIMHAGRILADGAPGSIGTSGSDQLEAELRPGPGGLDALRARLDALPGVAGVSCEHRGEKSGGGWTVARMDRITGHDPSAEIVRTVVELGGDVRTIGPVRPSLERTFADLLDGAAREASP